MSFHNSFCLNYFLSELGGLIVVYLDYFFLKTEFAVSTIVMNARKSFIYSRAYRMLLV